MPSVSGEVVAMATKTGVLLTADSPRDDLLAELARLNRTAKSLQPSPIWAATHARINELLDWLVGR